MPSATSTDASDPAARSLVVLAARRSHEIDGIYDYTQRLAEAMREADDAAVEVRDPGREMSRRFLAALDRQTRRGPVTVVVQYNPFSFGKWGFAPWLPLKLWRVRRSAPAVRLVLMLHEPYVPMHDWRTLLMGLWQRVQLRIVRFLCDAILMSIEGWRDYMRGWPHRPTRHLPVGSNLPDSRDRRRAVREHLGVQDDRLVLATFGSGNAARLMEYVGAAANAVASTGSRPLLLNLGAGAPPVPVGSAVDVVAPGPLEAREVAGYLAAADLFLAPFIDGVSTRRTTVMAALQHGIPVLGTAGPLTDHMLNSTRSGMVLVPVGEARQFAAVASELVCDGARRAALARDARRFYEREIAWDVAADRMRDVLRRHNGSSNDVQP